MRLVDDQICVVRTEKLVNNLGCHAVGVNGPFHTIHAVDSRAMNTVLLLSLRAA